MEARGGRVACVMLGLWVGAIMARPALAQAPIATNSNDPISSTEPASPGRDAILADATTPGGVTAYTTLLSAGFEWSITGDDDGDCAVSVEYRRIGDAAWLPAQALLRVEHGLWTHGEDPGNLLAGSIFFLEPGTAYEARLTLSDPDGGSDQRVVAFTTRVEPRASPLSRVRFVVPGNGGGSGTALDPFRGLAAADAAAQPGDLFLLQPGTYHGDFMVTRDGTASSPIVYRGVDPSSVILDGDGGTSGGSHSVDLTGRRYVFVESVSLIDCLRPVCADGAVGVVIRGCTIRPIDQLLSVDGIRAATSRDLFISDNTIQMPGQWTNIGRTGSYGTGGYGILIEGTGHVICHNTIVEAWDAISIPATGTAVPACVTSNVDIYENFVDRGSDDGVQADATQHNIRIFRNRLLNTGSAVSFQPGFGGPGYILYNEMYNTRIEPYKFHQETSYGWTQETSGFFVFHNTSICSKNGWYESGIWRHATFRDNLLLGGRANTPTFQANYTYPGASFDYDGLNRVNGYATLVRFGGRDYANLPAFYSGAANEQHGMEVGLGDFVRASYPVHPEWDSSQGYGTPYSPSDIDLQLAASSGAIDHGLVLPNIDSDYAGAAPDLGCYERGRPVPAYGPRAGIALDVPSSPALAVGLRLLAPRPNPTTGAIVFSIEVGRAARVSVQIMDVGGRRVRSLLADRVLESGVHSIRWDGRDEAGSLTGDGVYFVELRSEGQVLTRKIAMLR